MNKPDRELSVRLSNLQFGRSCGWLPDDQTRSRAKGLEMGTDIAAGCDVDPKMYREKESGELMRHC